ncbi:MAG: serine hydrolase [Rhodospirillales bacterium]|nr:serine hydrolase [Rhodospirillales bacterium]
MQIDGISEPAFEAVRAAFEENFRTRGEVGAAVCVYKDGRKVVDLWGGIADLETGRAWARDTLVCMMSVGKGMAGLCVHQLIDRGEIEVDAPVARYWPRFAQNGKEAITVGQLLGGLAGLIYADAAPENSILDWDVMIDALERQAPEWKPGTQGAYHSMSAGFLLGELVQKVDGRRIDAYFRDEIARKLGIEYGYGLDDEQIARTARIVPNPGSTTSNAIADRSSKLGRAWKARPAGGHYYNDDAFRRAIVPSTNGHGNARAVARVYAALAQDGAIDGARILSPAAVARLRTQQWDSICGMTDRPYRYGMGVFLNKPPMVPMGPNPNSFGHPGAGGAIGFADPDNNIAFSFSPNFMCAGAAVGDRCESLIEAVYA